MGEWLKTVLPSPGRMQSGRHSVIQLKTNDCWLLMALGADAPHRQVEGKSVPMIELAGSMLFPLNGNGTYYEGGDSIPVLKVTLASTK